MDNVDTIPKNTVIQYVRNKKRVPHGVLVALKVGSGFICGYSLCNKKDRFNKKMALRIAIGRGTSIGSSGHNDFVEAPHEVRRMLPNFLSRCKKYYKVR